MFLVKRFGKKPLVLKQIKASDISDFILRHCPVVSLKTAQWITTSLRSFLRFLFQKVSIGTDLAASVLGVAHWEQATLPKYISSEEVQRVLRACDRRTSIGRRDYAILLLLAPLGLRAGEVVALQLRTSTGGQVKSSFGARGCVRIGCPCQKMWERLSRHIFTEIALRATHAGCSFA